MSVMKSTLLICTIAGCWQPPSWKLSFKYIIIYRTYAMFLTSLLYLFTISEFMYIILNADSSDDYTDSLYMLLSIFVTAYKQVSMWINYKRIMAIINVLSEKLFASCDSCEVTIQEKFEKMSQTNTSRYLNIVMLSVITIFSMSIFTNLMKRNLTYKAWIPFDYSSPAVFYIVYAHQLLAMVTSGIVNIACDSLLCGFLLYICCQLEILEYRLTKMVCGQYILRDCIIYHNYIFEYTYAVNVFARIIAIQFVASAIVVCSNLYRIFVAVVENDYITTLIISTYTFAILMQIFLYCWFGNKVKLKSLHLANSIYDLEWRTLTVSTKKALLLIMNRAKIPIEFKSISIITMNRDSYLNLLKLSYSAFNVLYHTR
ncbi:ObirOr5-E7 [Ooceraea biroi]|uniref:Odorant receptor n=1 Tax=Ooceraea biroi TaxID=2015173 RepID=A0A3L8DE46_OOCBI|nr:odorant receptor 46a [Ooceraea biroi]RLU18705.1 ObirOr5-E7 [Ooceraea biroi]